MKTDGEKQKSYVCERKSLGSIRDILDPVTNELFFCTLFPTYQQQASSELFCWRRPKWDVIDP